MNLDRAKVIDGWFAESELEWVAQQAKHAKVVVEIGSWHGRSSRGIADNLPEGGVLFCVDTWNGSSGEPEMHGSAKLREGDHAHSWWWCNLHDLILRGKVIPVRMSSHNAAITLNHLGVKADMIFVDADHSYDGVKTDILAWRKLLKDGGLFCGHDYYTEGQEPFAWMGVRQCINEMFPDVQQALGTSIWYSRSKPVVKANKFACFITDDLDETEAIFRQFDSQVDRFVVIETRETFDGQPKPLRFSNNLERFGPWMNKITHLQSFDFKGDPHDVDGRKRWLWDSVTVGLNDCKDEDEITLWSARKEVTLSYAELKASSPSTQLFGAPAQFGSPDYDKVVEHEHRTLINKWFADVPKDAAILDLGAGNGVALNILREQGFTDVQGIDIAPSEGIMSGDMHETPFFTHNFDVVYCVHALEHAQDPMKVLNEIKRVLKPDGQLFLALPYPDYIYDEHRAKVHCGSIPLGLNVVDNAQTLFKNLESAGFKQVAAEGGTLRNESEIYLQLKPERNYIYDCFIFHNELDVLEIRLATLYDVVDRFVLVEGPLTHSGQPKPLYFEENKERFSKYLNKISHVVVDDWPTERDQWKPDAWVRERHQRDAILNALRDCADNDIIVLGDADEIPSPEVVANYDVSQGLCRLKQRMFYYYLNCENKDGWDWQKIGPYKTVRELTPCGVRYPPSTAPLIERGGWHFSFLGGTDAAIEKIKAYAHQEFNTPELTDRARVERVIAEGGDILGRDIKYEFVDIDENYPQYVRLHAPELQEKGLIKPLPLRTDYPADTVSGNVLDFKQPRKTVTACVSTKDRYFTTLPMTLAAIANQIVKPDKLKLYDDGEQLDLRVVPPYDNLVRMLDEVKIDWEIIHTPRKGQVTNHQHCLENAETDLIWRVDDDEIPEPNCLAELLKTMVETKASAVGGLVHHPGAISPLPNGIDGSLNDVSAGLNIAWFDWNGGPREVQHLYSTFLYDVQAGRKVGYPRNLSTVGHREETIFTHQMYRAGYKLAITPHAKTFHLRESTGGIRSFNDKSLWAHDEAIYQTYLNEWGAVGKPTKLLVLDCGLGDHFMFKSILPRVKEAHKDKTLILAVCYPDVFKDDGLTLISIAEARNILGERYDESNLYKKLWDAGWSDHVIEGFLKVCI